MPDPPDVREDRMSAKKCGKIPRTKNNNIIVIKHRVTATRHVLVGVTKCDLWMFLTYFEVYKQRYLAHAAVRVYPLFLSLSSSEDLHVSLKKKREKKKRDPMTTLTA